MVSNKFAESGYAKLIDARFNIIAGVKNAVIRN